MRCPPSFWLVVKLRPARAADRWRSLLLVHSRTASGSTADRRLHQRVEGFQKSRLCLDRRLAAAVHSTHLITQLHGARSQISKARPIVLRAIPVTRDTAATPPRPAVRASLAASRRRSLSFRNGESAWKRAEIGTKSIMRGG
jgi:hypothetical protein